MSRGRAGAAAKTGERFYRSVEVVQEDGAHLVALDGAPMATPGRARLALPTCALAEAVAAEWRAQGAKVRPAAMPVTRIVNTGIDRVGPRRSAVEAEVLGIAASDLVLYRAAAPAGLVARQAAHWGPVVHWAEGRIGARLVLGEGVVPVVQPGPAVAGLGALIAAHLDIGLAALATATTLTGSALIALALAEAELDAEAAWAAAHVDEDWQIAQWGEDAEAAARRAAMATEFAAAARILAVLRA